MIHTSYYILNIEPLFLNDKTVNWWKNISALVKFLSQNRLVSHTYWRCMILVSFFLYQHRCINIWLPCTTLLNLKSLSLCNLYCTHTPPTPSLVMCILTIIGTVQCTHVHRTHTHQATIPVCTLVHLYRHKILSFLTLYNMS